MSENLSKFCCQNESCSLFGIRNTGKITVTDRYGKNKDKLMLRCSVCKSRFSENKGTIYYGLHKSKDKVDSILRHIQEGVGIRKTGRLEKVHKDTVVKYTKLVGKHAYKLHNELVSFPPNTKNLQFDEKWAFVYEKEKNSDSEYTGDCWDYVGFDPDNKLVIAVVPGKRNKENTNKIISECKARTSG